MTQVKRKLMHRRCIESYGFLRDDGLWDIEANMKDIKSYHVNREFDDSLVPEGSPFHDISVRLTLDDTFLIKEVSVSMDAFPFPSCGGAAPNFSILKGTRIGPGWGRWLKKRSAVKSVVLTFWNFFLWLQRRRFKPCGNHWVKNTQSRSR